MKGASRCKDRKIGYGSVKRMLQNIKIKKQVGIIQDFFFNKGFIVKGKERKESPTLFIEFFHLGTSLPTQ